MSSSRARLPFALGAVAAVVLATVAWAGDPVPDVDVILEQIPGGWVMFDSPTGGFDGLEVDVGKPFAGALTAVRLPPGWALETKNKTVRLSGPALPAGQPVRLVLDAGSAPRPRKISYRVELAGRTLLERKNEPVVPVPPRKVIGSLQGIVTVPSEVAPGEPMQMRVTDPAALPAGGTWRLSGVVVEEQEETGEEERRRVALVPAPGEELPPAALDGIAGLLAVAAAGEGPWEITSRPAPAAEPGASPALRYQVKGPSGIVANVKQLIQQQVEIRPRDGDGPAGEEDRGNGTAGDADGSSRGGEVVLFSETEGSGGGSGAEGGDGGDDPFGGFCFERLPSDTTGGLSTIEAEDTELAWWLFCTDEVEDEEDTPPAIRVEWVVGPDPGGGLIYDFDVAALPATAEGGELARTIVDTTRSNLEHPPTTTARAAEDGTVAFVLPDDLRPGEPIALQYVDLYGDVVVDVPSVPGVEVVQPAADGGGARITDAMPRTSAGQQACVCGLFPGAEAWNALLLDGEPLGAPVSASSRMAWIGLPPTLAPGPHVVSGAADRGFPAADRATIVIVEIGGEVDSTKLQRLESTPMRLWVTGTSEPVDLRVRNKTPGIISIEGGDDQVIRTSGGEPNQLERTVHGLSPGAFDVEFELGGESCPCATADTHYW